LDDEHVSTAFSLRNFDVDVSHDRVHWFHLLGSKCARNEPLWNR
jgi:hypothetical protein